MKGDGSMAMTRRIKEQIIKVRDTGLVNMCSGKEVQRVAFDMDLFDLVAYIEDEPKEYFNFILTGRAQWAEGEEPDDGP